ncbi:hypothetical protein ACI65C_011873 [Semiaphis heraclei]
MLSDLPTTEIFDDFSTDGRWTVCLPASRNLHCHTAEIARDADTRQSNKRELAQTLSVPTGDGVTTGGGTLVVRRDCCGGRGVGR